MSRLPESTPMPEGEGNRPPAPNQPEVDDSGISALYANFVRVTGSAEELVVDFALNPQSTTNAPNPTVHVAQRVVVNFFTAKRLLGALLHAVRKHEEVFGVLELDIQKRVRPQVRPTT